MVRIVYLLVLFFAAGAEAGPDRPKHYTQFATAMVAWEALIDRARKPHPTGLTDQEYQVSHAIQTQEAEHVAHLLNPLLRSPEETYATGRYVLTGEGLECGLIRQLLRKAFRHLAEHRSHDYILFYLTGMGGILKEWGLIDEQMQVVSVDLKYPLTADEAESVLTCVEKILEKRRK